MSDKKKKFHEFALESSLFKGRHDWYFCFLKSEKIAHVLAVLAEHAPEKTMNDFYTVSLEAAIVPVSIVSMAAGRFGAGDILADIFSLMTGIRLLSTRAAITKETEQILLDEYEALAERLDAGTRLSPFVSADDFAVPTLQERPSQALLSARMPEALASNAVKDSYKGRNQTKGQSNRQKVILAFVISKNGVSIKDICDLPDPLIRGCSEKTIQRELGELIRQGHIKKIGERRWSQYLPA